MASLKKIARDGMKGVGDPFFQPLPSDVVRFWQEGKYSGGLQRSVEYDRLGWALMLRGIYTYETEDDLGVRGPKQTHRGFGMFDLYDGELRCYGIRVWTGASWDPLKELQHPLLWRSDVCAIQTDPVDNKARLRCVYRLLCPYQGKKYRKLGKEMHNAFDVFKNLWDNRNRSRKNPQNVPGEAGWAVTYLTKYFERDWGPMRSLVGSQAKYVDGAVESTLNNRKCSGYAGDERRKCEEADKLLSEQFQRILRTPSVLEMKELQKTLHQFVGNKDLASLRNSELTTLSGLLPRQDGKNDCLAELLGNCQRKTERRVVRDRFRLHLAYLWKAIHRAVVAGFTLELCPYDAGQQVRFQGEYGAFGRPAVGGKITFTRLDATTFNR